MGTKTDRSVRRDDLRNGFESRPTSRQQREEAERLNRGFRMMEESDSGEEETDDDE